MSVNAEDDRRRDREDDGQHVEERQVRPRSSAPHLPGGVIGVAYRNGRHHFFVPSKTNTGGVIGVAYRNGRHHFFVPSKTNTFCGITYPYLMVDSGCNSLLLPFPQQDTENEARK
jgi:hypothetical protein